MPALSLESTQAIKHPGASQFGSEHWRLGISVSASTDVHLIEAAGAEGKAGDFG